MFQTKQQLKSQQKKNQIPPNASGYLLTYATLFKSIISSHMQALDITIHYASKVQ